MVILEKAVNDFSLETEEVRKKILKKQLTFEMDTEITKSLIASGEMEAARRSNNTADYQKAKEEREKREKLIEEYREKLSKLD